jgi:hypothetical protein
MLGNSQPRNDPDYLRGYRDGRMDALIARVVLRVPTDLTAAYRAGYSEGRQSIHTDHDAAA